MSNRIFLMPICFDPGTMMLIATVAAVGGTVYSGMEANKQGQEQQKLYEEQARIQQEETATAVSQKNDERRRMLATQRMAYLANGVELTGTPLIVGDETFKEYDKEISAIQRSGNAKVSLLNKQGSTAATSGRTQLISSLFSAGSQGLQGYATANSGIFK